MGIMRAASEAVISEIDDIGANLIGEKGEKPDDIKKTITTETENFESKYNEFENQYDELRQLAQAIHDTEAPEQVQVTSAGKTGWRAFKPNQALKPPFQEKERSRLEESHFCVLFAAYVQDGYNGMTDGNPINIHSMPLIEPTWNMSLIQRGLEDDKTLVIAMIM